MLSVEDSGKNANGGLIHISEDVIAELARKTIQGIPNIKMAAKLSPKFGLGRKGKSGSIKVSVEHSQGVIDIDAYVLIRYGQRIPDLAWDIQEKIKDNLDTYIDLINNKDKDIVESLYELTNLEIQLMENKAIYGDSAKQGTIFIDSLFSPIERINYEVENARVGQAIAGLFPTISLSALFGFESIHFDDLFEQDEETAKNVFQKVFKIPSSIGISQYKQYIQVNFVDKCAKGKLSPGVMCNPPDRLDGFHTYNACCRSVEDTGRHKENLARYTQYRRAYENWAEGDYTDRKSVV